MLKKSDFESLAAVRKALRKFLSFADEGARLAGLTPTQHQVLLAIKGQPGREWATITELAEALQVKHHAMVGLVNRCQVAGLVEREPDTDDRRVVRVVLTEKAQEILEKLAARNIAQLTRLREVLVDFKKLEELQ